MALEITGQRVALSFNLPVPGGDDRVLPALAVMGSGWPRARLAQRTTSQRLIPAQGPAVVALATLVSGYWAMNISADDAANAVGSLTAIHQALDKGAIAANAATPVWALVPGALGVGLGLAVRGDKFSCTVGQGSTERDAFCVYAITLASALTVVAASHHGMPVSTTHAAIGAVFGLGLLREGMKHRRGLRTRGCRLVDRGAARRIADAWQGTVPAKALLAAGLFLAPCALA